MYISLFFCVGQQCQDIIVWYYETINYMKINVKKLHPEAKLPAYAHPGDAGMDFFALEKTTIAPKERLIVKTGISIEIPEGYVGLVWDKSGIPLKYGLKTIGGVIDAGYRGEVGIGLLNTSDQEYIFEAGHKIAQMLIQKVEQVELIEVAELTETQRGTGGFGSTGK